MNKFAVFLVGANDRLACEKKTGIFDKKELEVKWEVGEGRGRSRRGTRISRIAPDLSFVGPINGAGP